VLLGLILRRERECGGEGPSSTHQRRRCGRGWT
jgi:hypothetical protein